MKASQLLLHAASVNAPSASALNEVDVRDTMVKHEMSFASCVIFWYTSF